MGEKFERGSRDSGNNDLKISNSSDYAGIDTGLKEAGARAKRREARAKRRKAIAEKREEIQARRDRDRAKKLLASLEPVSVLLAKEDGLDQAFADYESAKKRQPELASASSNPFRLFHKEVPTENKKSDLPTISTAPPADKLEEALNASSLPVGKGGNPSMGLYNEEGEKLKTPPERSNPSTVDSKGSGSDDYVETQNPPLAQK